MGVLDHVAGLGVTGLELRNAPQQCARLSNSETMPNLPSLLVHLSVEQCSDIVQLISDFPNLFSDTPTQTTVLTHDIDVGHSPPIRQHPYRVNATKRTAMKKEVEYLLCNGLAKPSHSP